MEITLEKIELVKDRTGVSYKEAKEALEAADGSVVDAIIAIEETVDVKKSNKAGEVANETMDKIKEFVKSDSYKDFILKSASEIGKLLKGDNLMIFVRDDDLIFESEIKNAVGKDCKIEVSEEIVLGGLKASTDLQTADDTLEKRLENEHEWFINNSKLSIV